MRVNKISFSVIIPVFNGEKFISRAIESCLLQTVQPDEIIVVDDGSTDKTESVVRAIESDAIRLLNNDVTQGPSAARNKGIRAATSSWILFLDADDIFQPRKIEIILACIQQNTMIRSIGHSFIVIGADQTQTVSPDLLSVIPPAERLSVFRTLLSNPVVTPSLAVSRTNNIYFNENLSFAEDHDFIIRTTERFGLWYLDLPLCSLGRRPLTNGGISSHRWEMRKGEMKMYIDYCKRNHLYLLIPVLLIFSILKHIKNLFVFRNSS